MAFIASKAVGLDLVDGARVDEVIPQHVRDACPDLGVHATVGEECSPTSTSSPERQCQIEESEEVEHHHGKERHPSAPLHR